MRLLSFAGFLKDLNVRLRIIIKIKNQIIMKVKLLTRGVQVCLLLQVVGVEAISSCKPMCKYYSPTFFSWAPSSWFILAQTPDAQNLQDFPDGTVWTEGADVNLITQNFNVNNEAECGITAGQDDSTVEVTTLEPQPGKYTYRKLFIDKKLDIDFRWNDYFAATLIVVTHETDGYVHSLGYQFVLHDSLLTSKEAKKTYYRSYWTTQYCNNEAVQFVTDQTNRWR